MRRVRTRGKRAKLTNTKKRKPGTRTKATCVSRWKMALARMAADVVLPVQCHHPAFRFVLDVDARNLPESETLSRCSW